MRLGAVLVIVLALAACGGGDESTHVPVGSPAAQLTTAVSSDATTPTVATPLATPAAATPAAAIVLSGNGPGATEPFNLALGHAIARYTTAGTGPDGSSFFPKLLDADTGEQVAYIIDESQLGTGETVIVFDWGSIFGYARTDVRYMLQVERASGPWEIEIFQPSEDAPTLAAPLTFADGGNQVYYWLELAAGEHRVTVTYAARSPSRNDLTATLLSADGSVYRRIAKGQAATTAPVTLGFSLTQDGRYLLDVQGGLESEWEVTIDEGQD